MSAFALVPGRHFIGGSHGMAFYVCFETPGYAVTIHRGACRFCRNGTFQSENHAGHLSWSPALESFAAALEHVRAHLIYLPPAHACPFCRPEREDEGGNPFSS